MLRNEAKTMAVLEGKDAHVTSIAYERRIGLHKERYKSCSFAAALPFWSVMFKGELRAAAADRAAGKASAESAGEAAADREAGEALEAAEERGRAACDRSGSDDDSGDRNTDDEESDSGSGSGNDEGEADVGDGEGNSDVDRDSASKAQINSGSDADAGADDDGGMPAADAAEEPAVVAAPAVGAAAVAAAAEMTLAVAAATSAADALRACSLGGGAVNKPPDALIQLSGAKMGTFTSAGDSDGGGTATVAMKVSKAAGKKAAWLEVEVIDQRGQTKKIDGSRRKLRHPLECTAAYSYDKGSGAAFFTATREPEGKEAGYAGSARKTGRLGVLNNPTGSSAMEPGSATRMQLDVLPQHREKFGSALRAIEELLGAPFKARRAADGAQAAAATHWSPHGALTVTGGFIWFPPGAIKGPQGVAARARVMATAEGLSVHKAAGAAGSRLHTAQFCKWCPVSVRRAAVPRPGKHRVDRIRYIDGDEVEELADLRDLPLDEGTSLPCRFHPSLQFAFVDRQCSVSQAARQEKSEKRASKASKPAAGKKPAGQVPADSLRCQVREVGQNPLLQCRRLQWWCQGLRRSVDLCNATTPSRVGVPPSAGG
jgi:hypothetical protein